MSAQLALTKTRTEDEMWEKIKAKLDSMKYETQERIKWIDELKAKGCHGKLVARARKYSIEMYKAMKEAGGHLSQDLDDFLFGEVADDQGIQ
jgi:hypothetical protein